MEIREVKESDFEAVLKIIASARTYFKSQNSPQWQGAYPGLEDLERDHSSKQGYVLVVDDQVVGYGAIVLGVDHNYDYIEGKWDYDEPYGVLHRLCIAENCKGKGYAHEFFKYMEELCIANKRYLMRIDTHELNQSMQRVIAKEGFKKCGVVYMSDQTPRFGYEKKCSI